MSISSIKRLSMRARNSISMLKQHDTEDDTCSADASYTSSSRKENDALHAGEFGTLTDDLCSSPTPPSQSPSQGSPSKRMKLLRPLRSVSSFRLLRNPPPKEEPVSEGPLSWAKSPTTPTRKIRPPSLKLDFEESPKDQPMFDLTPEKHGFSSSLIVNHSSPLPIPTSAKPDMIALPEFSFWSGLPPGTVPTTPAPLQLALNMDPDRLLSSRESPSPTSNEAGMHMPPLPSPLPGTNVGFDDAFAEAFASYETCSASQLGHSEISHRQIALSSDSPFHCQFPHPESKWLQPARTRQSLTEQSSSPFINAGKSSDLHAGMQRNILAGSRGTNDWSQEHEAVLDSIEHISSLVFPEPPRIKDCQKCRHQIGGKALENPAGSEPLCSCSPEGQIPCNAPPQIHLHKMYGPRDDPLMLPKCRGLYDGTGYGDSISSMISLPSSLSTLEPYHDEVVYNLSGLCKPFTAKNDRTQGNTADDETLEDVILAYATYDEGAGEKQDTNHPDYANSSEDIAAETQADVELADRVAECSLGA